MQCELEMYITLGEKRRQNWGGKYFVKLQKQDNQAGGNCLEIFELVDTVELCTGFVIAAAAAGGGGGGDGGGAAADNDDAGALVVLPLPYVLLCERKMKKKKK